VGTVALAILCSALLLVGLLGVVLPILPGIPLAWLGLFIYAIGTGFDRISVTTTVVFFVLTVLALALDFAAPMLGAKKYKGSKYGALGAFVGFAVGTLTLGPWGIIVGPFLGAFLGELLFNREPGQAFQSAVGTLIGFLAGALFKIVLILVMAGFFIASLL